MPWICGLGLSSSRTVIPRRINVRASSSPMKPSPPVIKTRSGHTSDLNLFAINVARYYRVRSVFFLCPLPDQAHRANARPAPLVAVGHKLKTERWAPLVYWVVVVKSKPAGRYGRAATHRSEKTLSCRQIVLGACVKPRIVLSGVNFVEGGPLSVFKDALRELADHYAGRYEIVALVHRRICSTSDTSPTSNSLRSSPHGLGACTLNTGDCALSVGGFDHILAFHARYDSECDC